MSSNDSPSSPIYPHIPTSPEYSPTSPSYSYCNSPNYDVKKTPSDHFCFSWNEYSLAKFLQKVSKEEPNVEITCQEAFDMVKSSKITPQQVLECGWIDRHYWTDTTTNLLSSANQKLNDFPKEKAPYWRIMIVEDPDYEKSTPYDRHTEKSTIKFIDIPIQETSKLLKSTLRSFTLHSQTCSKFVKNLKSKNYKLIFFDSDRNEWKKWDKTLFQSQPYYVRLFEKIPTVTNPALFFTNKISKLKNNVYQQMLKHVSGSIEEIISMEPCFYGMHTKAQIKFKPKNGESIIVEGPLACSDAQKITKRFACQIPLCLPIEEFNAKGSTFQIHCMHYYAKDSTAIIYSSNTTKKLYGGIYTNSTMNKLEPSLCSGSYEMPSLNQIPEPTFKRKADTLEIEIPLLKKPSSK